MILLVEDEKNIAAGIEFNLKQKGFEVTHVANGKLALALAKTQPFELIILDVMLPDMDGFTICKNLRASRVLAPILMLTALGEIQNRITGLDAGADDYLPKPFDLQELLARVQSLLRRQTWAAQPADAESFRVQEVEFNSNRLELKHTISGAQVELTAIESNLLKLLFTNAGRTLSRGDLLKQVWGVSETTQTRTLDTFIMRIRQHLASLGADPNCIESVRGVGYRLELN